MSFLKKLKYCKELIVQKNIPLYASAASFYLALSTLPMAIALGYILSFFPKIDFLVETIVNALPTSFQYAAKFILLQSGKKHSPFAISAFLFTALWSSSRGMLSTIDGVMIALNMPPSKGYFKRRLAAALYFILLSVGWIFLSVLFIWGQFVVNLLLSNLQSIGAYMTQIFRFRTTASFILLSAIFSAIYYFSSSKKLVFKKCMKSAVLVSAAWIAFSFAFSFYVQYISTAEKSYGNIGLIMLYCIWLRSCITLFLCGGVVAKYIV